MKLPSKTLPLPTAYYDKNSGGYWYQDAKGSWVRFQLNDLTRFLKSSGYSSKLADGQIQSEVDRTIMDIQMKQNVDYAGSLAGYSQGLIEMEGKSVLVTDSPKIIQPVPGNYDVLHSMLLNMFGAEQLPYFEAWIKLAYESVSSGQLRPGQALVLAGPRNSGKSLLQQIVTKVLGGRTAHPYLHMTGGTAFNSELFGAEHLSIDDQCGSSDYRSRQRLTAQFKMVTAAGSQQCHPKGKPAVTLIPFWRLTNSVNDDPESLLVLPLIREDLEDKIMLFKIGHHEMPMPTRTNQEREAFWNQLMVELPRWLHYLTQWEIPAEMKANRFGLKHYHHPDIMEAIEGLSPEMKLYDLLKNRFGRCVEGWRGTASELEALLGGDMASTRYEARKLFTFNHACGRYLERLSKKHPTVVMRDGRVNDCHYWRIAFPQIEEVEVALPVRRLPAPPFTDAQCENVPATNIGLAS